jgi:hypothetical protein
MACPHEILLDSNTGAVKNGDTVRFKSTKMPNEANKYYNMMYSSDKGWIYYD